MDDKRLELNLNGKKFELSKRTVDSILENDSEASRLLLQNKEKDSLFLERNAEMFISVLGYFQGRGLHVPSGFCLGEFTEELKFWGVDLKCISKCCMGSIIAFNDDQEVLKILENDQNTKKNNKNKLKKLASGNRFWKSIQAKGWLILEEPNTSLIAKVYFFVSAVLVLASIIGLVCMTHPTFRRPLRLTEWKEYFGDDFHMYEGHFLGSSTPNTTLPPLPKKISTKEDFLYYIEYITVAYFTIEIFVRVILFPFSYKYFLLDFLNWVDIFSLIVMYSIYFVNLANPKEKYEKSLFDIIHCFQIIRVFRLFRLVKNVSGFRVLLYAVKASWFEGLLMCMFLVVGMLMFGACAFFSGDAAFPNIPDSFWWAVVTMTTVGYGDMVPTTGLSKLNGALCAITGVCLLAVIIPIFVNNFVLFYNYSKVWGTTSEKELDTGKHLRKSIRKIEVFALKE